MLLHVRNVFLLSYPVNAVARFVNVAVFGENVVVVQCAHSRLSLAFQSGIVTLHSTITLPTF